MTAAAIVRKASEEGLNLTLTPGGNIKAVGEGQAVVRWLPVLQRHKSEIVNLLRFRLIVKGEPVLIDGLTLWLSAVMGDDPVGPDPVLDGPFAAALEAIATRPGPVVVVSDEIGSGIVPMHAGARVYRDLVGIAHQRIAAEADEVHLLVAGLPIRLKGPTP
jgi:adenosylcobinamide kinase/adenosylcobinamide-phosphate guanylyltransferase